MCLRVCVCVCVCVFVNKKKSKYQVGSGNVETLSSSYAFLPSASPRSTAV